MDYTAYMRYFITDIIDFHFANIYIIQLVLSIVFYY